MQRKIVDDYVIYQHLLKRFTESYRLRSSPRLRQMLKENKRLVWVVQHGAPVSWVPLMPALINEMIKNGGKGRTPLVVAHRIFHYFPVIRHFAPNIMNSKSDPSKAEIIDSLKKGDLNDVLIMPEGDHCFFGEPDTIRPFKGHGFLDIARSVKCPLVLVAQHGAAAMGKRFPLTKTTIDLLSLVPWVRNYREIALKTRALSFFVLPEKTKNLEIRLKLYEPSWQRPIHEEVDIVFQELQSMAHHLSQTANNKARSLKKQTQAKSIVPN